MTSLLDLPVLLNAVSGFCLGNAKFSEKRGFSSVVTDSRNVKRDSLFVPLVGENQNGHIYIKSALEKGASVVFIESNEYNSAKLEYDDMAACHNDVAFIVTKNNLHALQSAAAAYIDKFPDLIRIGVTGSSGKTTTKEILVSILKEKYKVIANEGNLNSETGLPLSVFNIRKEHEIGVFEMGMNRVDEIGELARVLRPRYAVVTNIGTAHIGILGSRENIAAEKKKIFSQFSLSKSPCFAFIPEKDDFSSFLADGVNGTVIKYGADDDKNIKFEEDCGLLGSKFAVDGVSMTLNVPGIYNYRNACAAVKVALSLGLSPKEIKSGVEAMKTIFGRCEVIKDKYTIIQDCYNANPDSMEKAIDFCSSVKYDGKKIFVLGDMLELGAESEEEHSKIGKIASFSSADVIIFVGDEMKYAHAIAKERDVAKKIFYFNGRDDIVMQNICDIILKIASNEDLILLKASRGMGLERLTKLLLGK